MSCFKHLPLNSTAIFELSIYFSFGARILPAAVGGLIISSGNPLDFHAMTVSVSPAGLVKV